MWTLRKTYSNGVKHWYLDYMSARYINDNISEILAMRILISCSPKKLLKSLFFDMVEFWTICFCLLYYVLWYLHNLYIVWIDLKVYYKFLNITNGMIRNYHACIHIKLWMLSICTVTYANYIQHRYNKQYNNKEVMKKYVWKF